MYKITNFRSFVSHLTYFTITPYFNLFFFNSTFFQNQDEENTKRYLNSKDFFNKEVSSEDRIFYFTQEERTYKQFINETPNSIPNYENSFYYFFSFYG